MITNNPRTGYICEADERLERQISRTIRALGARVNATRNVTLNNRLQSAVRFCVEQGW